LTHSEERRYQCGTCGKAFKRQDHLNGHLLTHRSTKPFVCKVDGCEKSYCDARSLRRHRENHHGGSGGPITKRGGGGAGQSKATGRQHQQEVAAKAEVRQQEWLQPAVTTTATIVAIPSELVPSTAAVVSGPTVVTTGSSLGQGIAVVKTTADAQENVRMVQTANISEAATDSSPAAAINGQLIVNAKGLSVQQVQLIEQLFQDSKNFAAVNGAPAAGVATNQQGEGDHESSTSTGE